MSLYYFDLRDGGHLSIDEDGMELPTMQAVQIAAARSLVDIALKQTSPTSSSRIHYCPNAKIRNARFRSAAKV